MNWRQRSTPTKPLMMEMNVNSCLSIHGRRDKEFHPAKLTEWVSQKEVFFIRCEEQARLYRKSSYLCVYQPKGEASYVTGCKPNIRSDDSNRFMLFRLVKLNEDEVATCTATTSIVPFIIKFEVKGAARFFEVSKDCKEVNTTEEKSRASIFHLKVEKCNYFRILYKTKDHVYYLHAPTKLVTTTSHQPTLSLSLTEDARALSYMAFYNASDAPSRSRKLHQRELSDLIESSTEDKLHITCQRSVDFDSRDASDLYVKQNEKRNSIRVKVKHGILKEDKEPDKAMYFTEFVLLNSIASFIIKFRAGGKNLFFKVSSDCKEVCTTEEKSKASRFHLRDEKSNYFKILYKTKGDQVYHLHATSSKLSLSLTEDANARSYMAFYNASDNPFHSRRLHQRELSDLIKSSTEDKLHITCQRSVDFDSRDASDLYVKQNKKRNSIRVKVKHGITKEDKIVHFTKFVLLNPIAPFIIKFRPADKDLFLEVSSDCKEVHTTEEKSKASIFHLKVERSNYFKILYKTKGGHVYYFHAPTKLGTNRQPILSLSLTEDARAQSYMAFYNASDTPSHSRRLHQRELSDLIESSTEDKLHITCQRSVDSDSRDASDLYIKQNEPEEENAEPDKEPNKEPNKEPHKEPDKEPNVNEAKFKSIHLTKFVLLNPVDIAPFIIKFRPADKDLFLEVSSDCKEVHTTEEKSKASTFHLEAEKRNYFKILYKIKGDQVYHLHAPATSSKLSLSLTEDASARSYDIVAFYDIDASDSRRLQQRELSDLIKSSREVKLHITCQRSADSDSMDASDFYVEQRESTFHVQVKHLEEKHKAEASSTHFTGFVLQCSTNTDTCTEQPSTTDSTQIQHSLTGTDSGVVLKTPLREDSNQIPHSTDMEPETLSLSTASMSSNTPLAEDLKQISSSKRNDTDSSANQVPTDVNHGIEECESKEAQRLSSSEGPKTLSVSETLHSSNIGTDVDIKILPPTKINQLSPSTSKSSVSASDPPSTQNSEKILPQSADKGSKTPSTKQLSSSDVPSSKPHSNSEEDSKQAKVSVGTDSETRNSKPAEHPRIMTASSSPLPISGPMKPQTPPRQKSSPRNPRANHSRGFFDRCSIM